MNMRSREEIIEELNESVGNDFAVPPKVVECLILEVLLDIRYRLREIELEMLRHHKW